MTDAPTRVRYGMIAATAVAAVMLYLDRACLSIVNEQVRADQGLSDWQSTALVSAFFWAYALFQIPAGWVGDRFGPRRVLAGYLFLWSLCTGLIGLATGFVALFALRLGCGAFEAGAYPLAAGVVRRWTPAAARATASGVVAVGGRVGAVVAPVLTAALAAGAAGGWRLPFLVYGAAGMAGAVVFFRWFRDRPADHPAVNRAEADLIGPAGNDPPAGWPPLAELAASRAAWACSLVQFVANFAWVFILTLFPKYLEEMFNTPRNEQAVLQALALSAGIAGTLAGGWVSDRAVRLFGPRWGRAAPVAASRLFVGAAYLGCVGAADPFAVALLLCVVAAATDAGTAPVWAWGQDVGGRYVGAVVGWANMWGNFGAALAPPVFQWLRDRRPGNPAAGWDDAFLLCAAAQIVAAAAAAGIDAREKIEK